MYKYIYWVTTIDTNIVGSGFISQLNIGIQIQVPGPYLFGYGSLFYP